MAAHANIFRHGDAHFPRALDRGKKKNSRDREGGKEGRDWKEIKGRRAGNRGGMERSRVFFESQKEKQ